MALHTGKVTVSITGIRGKGGSRGDLRAGYDRSLTLNLPEMILVEKRGVRERAYVSIQVMIQSTTLDEMNDRVADNRARTSSDPVRRQKVHHVRCPEAVSYQTSESAPPMSS